MLRLQHGRTSRTVLLALSVLSARVGSQSPGPVITRVQVNRTAGKRLFRKSDAIIASAFAISAFAIAPADRQIARQLQDTTAFNDPLVRAASRNVSLVGLPGLPIACAALYAVGRVTHHVTVAHVGLHTTEAIVLAEVANTALKGGLGRERPKSDINDPYDFRPGRGFVDENYRSLASAHTVSAFAFAAALTEETVRHTRGIRWCAREKLCLTPAWLVGPLAYGVAGVVGLSRMYNNEHWASDVVIGAGIGTLAGLKVVQYTHEHPSNRIDAALLHVSLIPAGRERMLVVASAQLP